MRFTAFLLAALLLPPALAAVNPAGFQRVAEVFLGPELTEVRAAHAEPVGGGAWN